MSTESHDTDKSVKWSDPPVVVTLVSLLAVSTLSVVAIVISVKASSVAKNSLSVAENSLDVATSEYALTAKNFYGARTPCWKAILDGDEFRVSSINDDIEMQKALISFPFGTDSEMELVPPDFKFPTADLKKNLQEFVNKNIHVEEGKPVICENVNLPILIDSVYFVKGEKNRDISLYMLLYTFTTSQADNNCPDIQFQGIYHIKHFRSCAEGEEFLKDTWDKIILETPK